MFQLNYQKGRIIDWSKLQQPHDTQYNPFDLSSVQCYNPIYEKFFHMTEENHNKISFETVHEFINTETIISSGKKKNHESHIKFAPLLDPIHYLIGKYEDEKTKLNILPSLNNTECISKISCYNNTAYVDCFFNFLCSKMLNHHKFPNAIDYYGSYLAIQKEFKFNASDDLSYLEDSDFFNDHKNKLYRIESDYGSMAIDKNTCNKRKKIIVEEEIIADSIECDCIESSTPVHEGDDLELMYAIEDNPSVESEDYETDSSNDSELSNSSDDSDSGNGTDNHDDDTSGSKSYSVSDSSSITSDDHEENTTVFIYDFPVQLICMEKCNGTLDSLLERNEIDEAGIESALTQVVFSLLVFQKCFSFTHNDLHTNNIAYIDTDIEYILYEVNKKKYYVPTYGRIFKIIDFGRSIFKFQETIFCSDSFADGGDAHSQYNFPPFMNERKPLLEPNTSFDLCRLGCSLYDFMIDDDHYKNDSILVETIRRWCTDDSGKNILYKKSGEERYPNFKLYKMISRIVHKHTPQNEITESMVQQYKQKPKGKYKTIEFNVDSLLKYYV